MTSQRIAERAPWGDFPKVIRNGDLGSLQREAEYQAAKAGDPMAALDLVDRLLTAETVLHLKAQLGDSRPLLLPVHAQEAAGQNMIPLALANVLSARLGLVVETDIVQANRVSRTDSGSDHRLAFCPMFDGQVRPGQTYLLLDDTLTMGGTIAALRGYVENRGGHVLAALVMTAHEGALDLPVKPKMLAAIAEKHGQAMNDYWKENFGHDIDQLTQGEAGHLRAAPSVDAIRDRLAEARHARRERVDAESAEATLSDGLAGLTPEGQPWRLPTYEAFRARRAHDKGLPEGEPGGMEP